MEADLDVRAERCLALVGAVERLGGARDVDDIIAIVRETARSISGADGVTFVLKEGDFCHYVDENAVGPLWKGRMFPLSACISGWCMLHGETAVIPDIYEDPRIPHDAYRPTFVRSLVMTPVGLGEPVAAIGSYWAERRDFEPGEVRMLEALARSTAAAIAAVQANEQVKSHEARIKALLAEMAHLGRLAELDHLSAALAHELRQPLTAAKMYVAAAGRLLNGGEPQTERARECLAKTDGQLVRIEETIQRIRDMTARGDGARELRSEPVRELIDEALAVARLHPRARGVKVSVDVPRGLPEVLADRIQVQQVLLNLLRNAFEAVHGRETRSVWVAARPQGDSMVELSVADSGAGLAPEVAQRLFAPFVSGKAEGVGIGLSISRRIVEAHGGEIAAAGRPGGGTVFRFTLPAAA